MHKVSLEEAKLKFSSLIKEVSTGEEVVIVENNTPIAKIISLVDHKIQSHFGSAKDLITMSDDFDEPLEDFKNYVS